MLCVWVCEPKILARLIDIIQPTYDCQCAAVSITHHRDNFAWAHWIVHEIRSWTKWIAIILNFTSSSSYKLWVCVCVLKPHEIFAKQSCKLKEISHNMISINRLKCFNKNSSWERERMKAVRCGFGFGNNAPFSQWSS